MDRMPAPKAIDRATALPSITEGEIAVGTAAHWQLMENACQAKFDQNAEVRAVLLATGKRPLMHVVRCDSKTLPGVIMPRIACASANACAELQRPPQWHPRSLPRRLKRPVGRYSTSCAASSASMPG